MTKLENRSILGASTQHKHTALQDKRA